MPAYNGKATIRPAIESVLNQTFTDFEFVIPDDCSTDDTREIIRSYNDSRIKLLETEINIGEGKQWNRTFPTCAGEYVKPFAQDDVLLPRALERMSAELDSHPNVVLVSCPSEIIDGLGNVVNVHRPLSEDAIWPGRRAISDNLYRFVNWIGEPCRVMFRKKALGPGIREGGHYGNIGRFGDIEFWFQILDNGDYKYINEILAQYRCSGSGWAFRNLSTLCCLKDILALTYLYEPYAIQDGVSSERFFELAVDAMMRHVGIAVNDCGFKMDESSFQAVYESCGIALPEIAIRSLRRNKQLHDEVNHLKQANTEIQRQLQDLQVKDKQLQELQTKVQNALSSLAPVASLASSN